MVHSCLAGLPRAAFLMILLVVPWTGCSKAPKQPSGDDATAPSHAESNSDLIPPLTLEPAPDGTSRVLIDAAAFATWCAAHELPPPPAIDAIDAGGYQILHTAAQAAATERSAATLGELGMVNQGYYRPEAARFCYNAAAELDPTDVRWPHLLGRVANDAGDDDGAVVQLTRALDLDPNDAAAHLLLGRLHTETGALDMASAHAEQYFIQRPGDTLGVLLLGQIAMERSDRNVAVTHFERAIQLDAENQPALLALARLKSQLNHHAEAEALLARANALPPNSTPLLLDPIHLAMHRRANSLGYLRQALRHALRHGRHDACDPLARQLAARAPRDQLAHGTLTLLASREQRWSDAAEHARRTLAINPEFAPGYEAIARAAIEVRDFTAALTAADRALETAPDFTHAHITRGLVLGSMSRWDEAMAEFEVGLAAFPDDVDGLLARGLGRVQLGDRSGGVADLERVVQLQPGHPAATRILAALRKSGG